MYGLIAWLAGWLFSQPVDGLIGNCVSWLSGWIGRFVDGGMDGWLDEWVGWLVWIGTLRLYLQFKK